MWCALALTHRVSHGLSGICVHLVGSSHIWFCWYAVSMETLLKSDAMTWRGLGSQRLPSDGVSMAAAVAAA